MLNKHKSTKKDENPAGPSLQLTEDFVVSPLNEIFRHQDVDIGQLKSVGRKSVVSSTANEEKINQ